MLVLALVESFERTGVHDIEDFCLRQGTLRSGGGAKYELVA
jgi:hypothetical protein